jgi:hypothetical protein
LAAVPEPASAGFVLSGLPFLAFILARRIHRAA